MKSERLTIVLNSKNAARFKKVNWEQNKKTYIANIALEQFFEREEKLPKGQRII